MAPHTNKSGRPLGQTWIPDPGSSESRFPNDFRTKIGSRIADSGSTIFERKLAPGLRIQDLRFTNENWRGVGGELV
eukprot:scaffold25115_cov32-Phaeocystis_antarctica.AAC.1